MMAGINCNPLLLIIRRGTANRKITSSMSILEHSKAVISSKGNNSTHLKAVASTIIIQVFP